MEYDPLLFDLREKIGSVFESLDPLQEQSPKARFGSKSGRSTLPARTSNFRTV
jgi:hypothetical protein